MNVAVTMSSKTRRENRRTCAQTPNRQFCQIAAVTITQKRVFELCTRANEPEKRDFDLLRRRTNMKNAILDFVRGRTNMENGLFVRLSP